MSVAFSSISFCAFALRACCKKKYPFSDYFGQSGGLRRKFMPDWEDIVQRNGPVVWRIAFEGSTRLASS